MQKSVIILQSSNEQPKHEENFIYNSIKKITRFNIRNTKHIQNFKVVEGNLRRPQLKEVNKLPQ